MDLVVKKVALSMVLPFPFLSQRIGTPLTVSKFVVTIRAIVAFHFDQLMAFLMRKSQTLGFFSSADVFAYWFKFA